MRAVIQRVDEASVNIKGENIAFINRGFLILLGIESKDTTEDVEWLSKKISQLRVFSDDEGRMNLSLTEIKGDSLVVSQFTLHAKTKKGNRPSYIKAARPEKAISLYEQFKKCLSVQTGSKVRSGKFGADMKVSLTNNGPVTIIIDTKNKE